MVNGILRAVPGVGANARRRSQSVFTGSLHSHGPHASSEPPGPQGEGEGISPPVQVQTCKRSIPCMRTESRS